MGILRQLDDAQQTIPKDSVATLDQFRIISQVAFGEYPSPGPPSGHQAECCQRHHQQRGTEHTRGIIPSVQEEHAQKGDQEGKDAPCEAEDELNTPKPGLLRSELRLQALGQIM